MTMKMEGYGETHTSTPNTTDKVREVNRVLDLPSLQTHSRDVGHTNTQALQEHVGI